MLFYKKYYPIIIQEEGKRIARSSDILRDTAKPEFYVKIYLKNIVWANQNWSAS